MLKSISLIFLTFTISELDIRRNCFYQEPLSIHTICTVQRTHLEVFEYRIFGFLYIWKISVTYTIFAMSSLYAVIVSRLFLSKSTKCPYRSLTVPLCSCAVIRTSISFTEWSIFIPTFKVPHPICIPIIPSNIFKIYVSTVYGSEFAINGKIICFCQCC